MFQYINALVKKFSRDEEGLTMVEYAVAAAMITIGAKVAFGTLGTNVSNTISTVAGYIGG